jgi:hypothetical protein
MTTIKELKKESTAVAVADDQKLPAAPATSRAVDPFDSFADEAAPQNIIGKLLVFNKGDLLVGRDKEEIPAGSKFTAGMDMLMAGYVKWRGNRPVNHALVRVGDGAPLPKRDHLGDHDKDSWEVGLDGDPRDPWQEVNYLPLLDDQGELYTFVVSGKSAITEAGHLSRAYARHRRTRPHEFPVIALNVGSYQHRDRAIGRVKYPEINCIGWTSKTDFMKALAAAGLVPDDAVADEVSNKVADEVPVAPASSEEPPPITEVPPARDDDIEF